jgi:hypothetical protein
MAWALFLVLFTAMAGLYALSAIMAPKPPQPPNAELQKQDAPQNDPSKYVGVAFGRVRTKDPIIAWSGNKKAVPIMSDQRGKK